MFGFDLNLLFGFIRYEAVRTSVSASRFCVFPVFWTRVTQNRVLVTDVNHSKAKAKAKLQPLATTPFSHCF
jgi:hypothetical protein